MKLLIADDEIRICKLLLHLIDWESYGLEIIGIAHNGGEEIRLIEKESPDIVITDIRMPGFSGLDVLRQVKEDNPNIHFIVISGYREFEYARDALKYGADDYLLKPIKKDELTAALQRILYKRDKKAQTECEKQKLEKQLLSSVYKLRSHLICQLLKGNVKDYQLTENYWEDKLQLPVRHNEFICLAIKVDMPDNRSSLSDQTEFVERKGRMILEQQFPEPSYLSCTGVYKNVLLAVLNTDDKDHGKTDEILRRVVFKIRELIDGHRSRTRITVGRSHGVAEIKKLSDAMHQAVAAMQERILKKSDSMIVYRNSFEQIDAGSYVNYNFLKSLMKAAESVNLDAALLQLSVLFEQIRNDDRLSGYVIAEIGKEVMSSFILVINPRFDTAYIEKLKECGENMYYNWYDINTIENFIIDVFKETFELLKQKRENTGRKSIRLATEYITNHYQESIDLDMVSREVGLNATYFSRIFKEETGKKFIEYLTEVRMHEAQRLLTETDMKVAEIAYQTGYADEKYFSRAFKKFCGLRPNEYRKLYFH